MKQRMKPQEKNGKRLRGLLHDIYKNRMIYLLISPFFFIYGIFWIFPIFYSFFLSFHKWGGVGEKKFVGLFYFQHLLQDSTFLLSIKNTLIIWVLSTIPMVIIAVILAFLLNGAFLKGKNFFRTVYYLPNITSTVAIAIVFANIFGNKYGILNFLISRLGFDPVQWMSLTWGVHVAIAAIVIWRWTGYNAIILLAGLQKISSSLYEAASLDGATKIQQFFHITLPMVSPTLFVVMIMRLMASIKVYDLIYMMVDQSNPALTSAQSLMYLFYRESFVAGNRGYASAIVVWTVLLIGVITAFQFWGQKKWVNYEV